MSDHPPATAAIPLPPGVEATRPTPRGAAGAWLAAGAALLALLCGAAVFFAWNTQQQVRTLEQELVRRQQDSANQATAAQAVAKQAQDSTRDAAAKLALLEARVSESTLQRSQLEELIQALSRSRDENVVADVEAAVRVAQQLSALTGSAEPLLGALRQSEERLARHSQPRLDRVRRALAHDIERAKAAGVVDLAALTIRLDEAIRLVDELPLLSVPQPRAGAREAAAASAPGAGAPADAPWTAQLQQAWQTIATQVWTEARALLRVTRIDQPEAMLIAPEQAFVLRENLKLRLLNARLALLSRQFDTVQSDLRAAQTALDKYFDRGARRVASTSELVRQVATQARSISLPKPDETLAAIAAAGR